MLAWLLTALTCLLAGMAIVESRYQVVALPHPAGTQGSVGTPDHLAPSRALLVDAALAQPAARTATLRIERLTVPPGTALPIEAATGPTVLLVEVGTLSVRADLATWSGSGLDAPSADTHLRSGQRLVISSGVRYAVRNDWPVPVVALLVTLDPAVLDPPTPSTEHEPRRQVPGE
jgi:hypothetical protein